MGAAATVEFEQASEEICKTIKDGLKSLNLGCGNSIMCEDMYDDGYKEIYNMDISQICIEQMISRNEKRRPEMKWETMDCRDLHYSDEFFDMVIDKSTIDALLCGNYAYLNVAIMLKECQRVLKTGGYYVAISYGVPQNREFHFHRAHLGFSLKTYQLKKQHKDTGHMSMHYIYVCKKLPGAIEKCTQNYEKVLKEIKLEIEEEKSSELSQNPNDDTANDDINDIIQ